MPSVSREPSFIARKKITLAKTVHFQDNPYTRCPLPIPLNNMPLQHDEIFEEVRHYKARDWSIVFLWGSLFVSVTMITGTMMWNLGKSMRTESYLKEHSIQTCLELNRPPSQMSDDSSGTPFKESCAQIVTQRHEHCVVRTQHVTEDLRKRRADYMMCVMEQQTQQASLHNADDPIKSAAPPKP